MAWLLDTNVICELGRKGKCHPKVSHWAALHRAEKQYLSVITLGEIRNGVELRWRKNAKEARLLEARLDLLCIEFDEAILPITIEIAFRWGCLNCPDTLPTADSLIAATALEHDLTVVTRNVSDFARSGVKLFNPFE